MKTAILNPKLMASLPIIQAADHSLSLGFTLYLATNSKYVAKGKRVKREQFEAFLNGNHHSEGLHAVWSAHRAIVIAVNGRDLPPLRIVELVTHEISHCVDGFFERAAVQKVDTEVRAYMIDWLVGKTLHHFDIFKK